MLWCIMPELSLCFGLILIIIYGLFSLNMTSYSPQVNILGQSSPYNGNADSVILANKAKFDYIPGNTTMVNLFLSDVYFFCRLWPMMLLLGFAIDCDFTMATMAYPYNNGVDVLLVFLTVVILQSFKSFESVLLLLLAFVGQLFMLHSCDLVSFYICLEAQNFCFLVLCGLQPRVLKYCSAPGLSLNPLSHSATRGALNSQFTGPTSSTETRKSTSEGRGSEYVAEGYILNQAQTSNGVGLSTKYGLPLVSSKAAYNIVWGQGNSPVSTRAGQKVGGSRPLAGVEASIKYLLLSAFSSGVLLFWFSALYLRTGITTLSWGPLTSTPFDANLHNFMDVIPQMLILLALMFKLGGAPLHIWMVDIYSGVKRQLLMYLSTAPKLSLFGFWVSTWHSVWTDFTVLLFVALSMIIGCFGAYNQPTLRSLFAYSTINEIGLMLMAIETAGFHSLFQHLSIYIITMILLWNNSDKRLFAILAVSLAGLPPLAGFFGKAWIFNSVATGAVAGPYLGVLLISLFCTGLSLVYYLRVFRLFNMMGTNCTVNRVASAGNNAGFVNSIETRTYSSNFLDINIKLTSFCVIFLFFAPLFYIKPFVL